MPFGIPGEKTLKELQAEAKELGIENPEVFTTRAQIMTVMTLKTKEKIIENLEPVLNPAEDKKSDEKWQKKADRMRKILENQPQVRILVPLEANEKQGVVEWRMNKKTGIKEQVIVSGDVQPVTLNGYAYYVPKGIYTEVPQQVADIITLKFNQTAEAGKNALLDRIDPSTGRPVAEQL